MADTKGIYVATESDTRELERGIRLCLWGAWELPERNPDGRTWEEWLALGEWKRLGAHLVQVYGLAQRMALPEVVAADVALSAGLLATFAEPPQLVSPDPLRKGVLRNLVAGKMPGHFATLVAVGAASFHVPLLTALQSGFFLEWRVRQRKVSHATAAQFLHEAASFLPRLVEFLPHHDRSTAARFGVR